MLTYKIKITASDFNKYAGWDRLVVSAIGLQLQEASVGGRSSKKANVRFDIIVMSAFLDIRSCES